MRWSWTRVGSGLLGGLFVLTEIADGDFSSWPQTQDSADAHGLTPLEDHCPTSTDSDRQKLEDADFRHGHFDLCDLSLCV